MRLDFKTGIIPLAALATFGGVYVLTPGGAPAQAIAAETSAIPVFYSGCNEVRERGLAPLYEGDPGYRADMDGDGDGVACEPYRGGQSGFLFFGRNGRRR
jgi:hypothetical protein